MRIPKLLVPRVLHLLALALLATSLVGCGGGGGGTSPSAAGTAPAGDEAPKGSSPALVLAVSGPLEASWRIARDNGRSYRAEITLSNRGTSSISDWRLEFDWSHPMGTISWGATVASSQGHHVVVPLADTRVVAAGTSRTFTIEGSPGNVSTSPGNGNLWWSPASSPSPAPSPAPSPSPTASPSPAPSPSPTASPSPSPSPQPVAGGFLQTQGARIVDARGQAVRLRGVNWFGFETSTYVVHGLWARSMDSMLDQIAANGYNVLRIPYSNEMLLAGRQVNGVDFSLNPDLQGRTPLQALDLLVSKAGQRGLKVVLDRHRPTAAAQSELWYTDEVPESRWISDWEMLAARYRGNPTVVGVDLHNEPHGKATWGDGNPATDWRLAAERAGNRVLRANPDLLILVEGIEVVDGSWYWWGGNLRAAGRAPVRLEVPGRLVYSTHDYPRSLYQQPWLADPATYATTLPAHWDATWGYLVRDDLAPVLVGEFGSKLETAEDEEWMRVLTDYMGSHGMSFTYWSWNPNSGDTGGLLMEDWKTLQSEKQMALSPLLQPVLAAVQRALP